MVRVELIRLIALITTPGGLTGAPRRLLTLAFVLKKEGVETCVATQSDSELLQAANAEGHKVAQMDAVGVLALRQGALFSGGLSFRLRVLVDLFRQNWRLRRCIRHEKGDAVWIRGSKGIAFGALGAVLSGRPVIWDVDYEPPSRGVVRYLHRLGLWASRAVVFQYVAAPKAIFGGELIARYQQKFHTIIPGIDLKSLKPFHAMREQRQRTVGEPFVILQAGSICDRKNQKTLIQAITLIRERRPNRGLEVWFAGGVIEAEYAAALRQEIEARALRGVVRFLGWRSDIHELMSIADLLVMPSHDEGVPNTVQEAMAIGLPVLVSEAGGMPEIVTDGDTGWILGTDAVSDWATRIQWCLDYPDECKAVGQRGCAYALLNFGTDHWGGEYSRVVMEVVGRQPEREVETEEQRQRD